MNQLSLLDINSQELFADIKDPQVLLEKIAQSGCTNCARGSFRNESKDLKITISYGNPRAKVWVIGKSPGIEDARIGTPFSFGSGDKLKELIKERGFDLEKDIFWINPVFCPMTDNATPTTRELAACSVYFKKLIDLCKPQTFIAVGGTAYTALTGLTDKIENLAGRNTPYKSIFNNIPVWVIYHTAYWFKAGANLKDLQRKTQITLDAFAQTVQSTAEKMQFTKGRISQIDTNIARKLRWPNRVKEIEEFINGYNK